MKHYLLIILYIFTVFLFQSCKSEKTLNPTKTIITGYVSNLDNHENKNWLEFLHPDLFSQQAPFEQIKIDSLGYFKYEIEIVSPALCWGIYNKWFPFVISPGDSLFLSIDANIWDDNTSGSVVKGAFIEFSGTVQDDYYKIIKFEEWACDSIYNRTNSRLKNEATKTKSAKEFGKFIQNIETETLSKIKKFGQDLDAGTLFYEILNAEIKYRTLDDLMRYWWINPLENGVTMENVVLNENYFTFLKEYEMENKDFFVVNRLDFIKELQFFLQFQNQNERKTFLDIYKNREIAKVNNEYFNEQANYIFNQTKGITRDLCLYFFALYNLKSIPAKSTEIYTSVSNLIKDSYVKRHLDEEFNSMLLENIPTNILVESDEMTALDSVIAINKGKIMYVDFWAPWCGPCMSEMKPSKQLREKLKGKNVIFIYLACNCSEKSWQAAIANNDIDGTNLLLSNNDYLILSKRYGISGIPHYLLIDKTGKTIKNALKPSDKKIESEILKLQ
jgi:thiol-disulfide isomerase/thioredoxin